MTGPDGQRPHSGPHSERGMLRPAIIFDCDGVLNQEPGGDGVLRPEDVRLLPGAGDAVKAARDAGCLTVIITNRAQVAKGLVSFAELDRIFGRVRALLAERGGIVDAIYFCPHHPAPGTPGAVAELAVACDCRKPGALLFRRAFAELAIDVARTVVIGDSLRDIGAGRAAGIWAYGVRTGYGCRDTERYRDSTAPTPDLMFADVGAAVDFCLSYRRRAAPVIGALPVAASGKPIVVAIAGRACAGKSTLAHAVARTLAQNGERCCHVPLGPAADALPAVMAALGEAPDLRVPPAELLPGAPDPSPRERADRAVILLDGDMALQSAIRPLVDLAVFVEAPETVRRARVDVLRRREGPARSADEAGPQPESSEDLARIDVQRGTAHLVLAGSEGAT